MVAQIMVLADQFLSWEVRNRVSCPDLTVRMRIACTHHRATILKDLHVVDFGHLSQFPELCRPGVDHVFDVPWRYGGKGEGVAWREANYAAQPGLTFCHEQTPVPNIQTVAWHSWLQRGKVIVENEGASVGRIDCPASS